MRRSHHIGDRITNLYDNIEYDTFQPTREAELWFCVPLTCVQGVQTALVSFTLSFLDPK